jgi:hypothetical protein
VTCSFSAAGKAAMMRREFIVCPNRRYGKHCKTSATAGNRPSGGGQGHGVLRLQSEQAQLRDPPCRGLQKLGWNQSAISRSVERKHLNGTDVRWIGVKSAIWSGNCLT